MGKGGEPCLCGREPPFLKTQQETGDCTLQKGLLKSHCKALLTIGCKFKKSYQTIEIQEDCFSSAGPPSLSIECSAAMKLFSSRPLTTTRGRGPKAGPA